MERGFDKTTRAEEFPCPCGGQGQEAENRKRENELFWGKHGKLRIAKTTALFELVKGGKNRGLGFRMIEEFLETVLAAEGDLFPVDLDCCALDDRLLAVGAKGIHGRS